MTAQTTAAPLVVVTRAPLEAQPWVQGLEENGLRVAQLPLLDLQDLPADELNLDWTRIVQARAIMVVSARAARALSRDDLPLAAALRAAWAQGRGPRIWAPGPGTAAALRAAGVAPSWIDVPPADAPQFDSENLWPVVAPQVQPGCSVVILRGQGAAEPVRDFLQQRCAQRGAVVSAHEVYRRGAAQWDALQQREFLRLRALPEAIWLFGSSQALQNLARCDPPQQPPWWVQTQALATHERIAQTAHELGWTRVRVCLPLLSDVVKALRLLAQA